MAHVEHYPSSGTYNLPEGLLTYTPSLGPPFPQAQFQQCCDPESPCLIDDPIPGSGRSDHSSPQSSKLLVLQAPIGLHFFQELCLCVAGVFLGFVLVFSRPVS